MNSSKLKLFSMSLIAIGLSNIFSSVSPAGNLCKEALRNTSFQRVSHDSSVEVEIGVSPNVMELFTTDDGTIKPVLGDEEGFDKLSAPLQQALIDFAGPEGDPLSTPWDLLTYEEKKEVIAAGTRVRWVDFFSNRNVFGLRYRSQFKLNFNKPTRFMGIDYPAGQHLFNSKDVFKTTAIEFAGHNRMRFENLGFELHVRSNLPAGENFLTSQSLQLGLRHSLANVHTYHIEILANQLEYGSDFWNPLLPLPGKHRKYSPEEARTILEAAEKNDFVKMLLHDWSQDPLYIKSPQRLQRLQEAQKYCIQLLLRGMPSVDVMAIFAKRSALAYDINNIILNENQSHYFSTGP